MKRQNKYNKNNTVQINIKLNKNTDAELIEYIEVIKKHDISINGFFKRVLNFMLTETAQIQENEDKKTNDIAAECRKILKLNKGEN